MRLYFDFGLAELRMREADHERRKMQLEFLENPRQSHGYDDTTPKFGNADYGPTNRQPFGYHNDVQMPRRPNDGMRRQQELEAEFIPQQIFTFDDNRPMQKLSPFVVFQGIFANHFIFLSRINLVSIL